MTTEQKAKAYDEALNWMRELYPGLHGATKEDAEHYFPELRESEDERIRKCIRLCLDECVHSDIIRDYERDECLAYLEKQKDAFENGRQLGIMQEQARQELGWPDEKQKEQKPAEWSEVDERMLTSIIARGSSQVPPYAPALREEQMEWLMNRLKSLRPQPHWKPSEEQMKWLKDAIETVPMTCRQQLPLESLYNDLLKLM